MPFTHRCKILRVQFHFVRVTEFSTFSGLIPKRKELLEWNSVVVDERLENVESTESTYVLLESQHYYIGRCKR